MACKFGRLMGRRASQVALAHRRHRHGFAVQKPGWERSCHCPLQASSPQPQWAAPPELGAVHEKHLEKQGTLGRDWRSDMAPFSISSWSNPKPGFLLYSLVLGERLGCEQMGWSIAPRQYGGLNKSTEMVPPQSPEYEAVLKAWVFFLYKQRRALFTTCLPSAADDTVGVCRLEQVSPCVGSHPAAAPDLPGMQQVTTTFLHHKLCLMEFATHTLLLWDYEKQPERLCQCESVLGAPAAPVKHRKCFTQWSHRSEAHPATWPLFGSGCVGLLGSCPIFRGLPSSKNLP